MLFPVIACENWKAVSEKIIIAFGLISSIELFFIEAKTIMPMK
jgi:hypothetical protein